MTRERSKLKKEEKMLKEKYHIDFEARKQQMQENNVPKDHSVSQTSIIEKPREKWYQILWKKIWGFFKRK